MNTWRKEGMHFQVQVVLDENDKFKLVVRLYTSNEMGLVHHQVLELDENPDKSFVKLFSPILMEFKGITATASPEVIQEVMAEQARKAAEIRAEQEKLEIEGATIEA